MGKYVDLDNNQTVDVFSEKKQPLLDELLKQKIEPSVTRQTKSYPYSLIGQISKLDSDGYAWVDFTIEEKHYKCKAQSTVAVRAEQIGQQCVMVFNQGNIQQPIISGLLQQAYSLEQDLSESKPLVFHSESGITLKCGSSRIELTEQGTINIQGMHINSQAYGPNCIKGGSVKIN